MRQIFLLSWIQCQPSRLTEGISTPGCVALEPWALDRTRGAGLAPKVGELSQSSKPTAFMGDGGGVDALPRERTVPVIYFKTSTPPDPEPSLPAAIAPAPGKRPHRALCEAARLDQSGCKEFFVCLFVLHPPATAVLPRGSKSTAAAFPEAGGRLPGPQNERLRPAGLGRGRGTCKVLGDAGSTLRRFLCQPRGSNIHFIIVCEQQRATKKDCQELN